MSAPYEGPRTRPGASPVLHVETRGAGGTPLVLLHGWGLNVRVWDRLEEHLPDDLGTVRIDLPGHGRSLWPFAPGRGSAIEQAELLATALPARCTLLGWSLGGQLALRLARLHPQRIARLVLVATTPRFLVGRDWPHGLPPSTLRGFAVQLARDPRQTIADFLELQVRGGAAAHQVLSGLRRALSAHGLAQPEALAAGLELLRTTDLRAELAAVSQRCLVVAGQHDRLTPCGAARALATALPHAQYHGFRRAAHAPFLSHPQEFAAALGNFLGMPGAHGEGNGHSPG